MEVLGEVSLGTYKGGVRRKGGEEENKVEQDKERKRLLKTKSSK